MSDKRIRVLLIEDDPDFIYLTKKKLTEDPRMDYIGDAHNTLDALAIAQSSYPDIVLVDLNLGDKELDGIEIAKKIRCTTSAKVLIVTSIEDYEITIKACTKSFASGYLFKRQFDTLLQTIQHVTQEVTPQEYFIFSLILNQLTTAEKAVFKKILGGDIHLISSDKTIANQKTTLLKKLGLRNQKEVIHIFKDWKNWKT